MLLLRNTHLKLIDQTYSEDTGSPFLDVTISLAIGGGLIGRLSLSPKPHIRAREGCCIITKS
jgi:hypothetical protein